MSARHHPSEVANGVTLADGTSSIALVAIDANLKLVGWEEVHELRENGSALVRLLPPGQAGKQ